MLRSPDIPLEFFILSGYIKLRAFDTQVSDIEILKTIKDAACIVAEEMPDNTWREVEWRLDILSSINWRKFKTFSCV